MEEGMPITCSDLPLCSSIENANDTSTITGGLSLASHAVITAVKPSPPDIWCVIDFSIAEACIKPATPHSPPEITTAASIILSVFMPA